MAVDDGTEGFRSISELREMVRAQRVRISTGWPVLDLLTQGLPLGGATSVRAPDDLRLQVLGRMAAWAAGEGRRVVLASLTRTSEELSLAVAAGGMGLPAEALLVTSEHDAWLDARLRVLDLHVHGGRSAVRQLTHTLTESPAPALVVIDDYWPFSGAWDTVLDPDDGGFEVRTSPLQLGASLVLGMPEELSGRELNPLIAQDIKIQLVQADRAVIICESGPHRETRPVDLVDGALPSPRPGSALIRPPGVTNIWEDLGSGPLDLFVGALGATLLEQETADGESRTEST